MDDWLAVEQERLALADDLTGMAGDRWDVQSLCAEWKVRHVVGHLVSSATTKGGEALVGLLKHGLNFNRATARDGLVHGEAEPAVLLARLKDTASSRLLLPLTKPVDVLLDVVCHAQDIRRPLGIAHRIPTETLVAVADRLKGYGFPFGTKKLIGGLSLKAADAEWSTGEGPVAEGPLEALVMAMAGRPAALTDLSGPGASTLQERLRGR